MRNTRETKHHNSNMNYFVRILTKSVISAIISVISTAKLYIKRNRATIIIIFQLHSPKKNGGGTVQE